MANWYVYVNQEPSIPFTTKQAATDYLLERLRFFESRGFKRIPHSDAERYLLSGDGSIDMYLNEGLLEN